MQKTLENIQLWLILSRKGSDSLFLTLEVTFSLLSEALLTQKNDVELTQRALNCYKPLKRAKYKKGHIRGIFGKNPPFFGPKSCVFVRALVILVGVCTYDNILRTSQNPTLAGMDPLTKGLTRVRRDFLLNTFTY